MKTISGLHSRSIMDKKILTIICLCALVAAVSSCKKEDAIRENGPGILTEKVKSELSATADKVFVETGTPGMIALISVEGEPDFILARGASNLISNDPMSADNAFRIASVTKTFTGTAVLMLADQGLINLDASVAFYLPEYNIPSGNLITIRMLGNMTSGLFNYSEDEQMWQQFAASGYTLTFPPDSLLALSFRHPLNFAPGTQYEYCNTNTVLLGLLIEKISGKPAGQYIHENITVPLGLNSTYFGGSFFMNPPYTHGYAITETGLADATNWNPSWGYTAGAIISNLQDMKKWAKHLANGDLLSDAAKAERFTFGPEKYGFCIESIKYKDDFWVGHPGTIPGYNTQVWYNKADKITLVINANTDNELPAQTLLIAFIVLLGDL